MNSTLIWYYWTHTSCKLAYSLSKEEGSPICLWNFATKKLDTIAKVGDEGWTEDGNTASVLPSFSVGEL